MQDIFDEVGLSAGAVYRYFPSKDAIIQAIAGRILQRLARAIEQPRLAGPMPPLTDWLAGILDRIDEAQRDDGVASIALQVWSESLRSPQLTAVFRDIATAISEQLSASLVQYGEAGRLPDKVDVNDVTSAVMALLQGYLVRRALFPEADSRAFRRGIRALIDPPDRDDARS